MGWSWAALGKRPIFFPVLFVLMGNAWADAWLPSPVPTWLFWVLGVVLLALGFLRGPRVGGLLALLFGSTVLGFGAGMTGLDAEVPSVGTHRLEGEIDSVQAGADQLGLVLAVARVDGVPTHFRAALSAGLPQVPVELVEGQRILVEAKLRPVVPASNDGEWNRSTLAARRGQTVTGGFELVRVVKLSAAPAWRVWLRAVHGRLSAFTTELIGDREASALVLTLAAGERASLGDELEDVFACSGLAHVLSVSGLHVAVIAFSLFAVLRWLLTRRMRPWSRRFDARAWAAPAAIPLVWGYVLFTGLQAPAVRSAVMCTLVLAGWPLRRRSDALNALAAAVLGMICVDPSSPYDLSVQLSFVAVLAMVWGAPLVRSAMPIEAPSPAKLDGWALRVASWREAVLQTAAASIAVTAGTAPLVLTAFQRVSVAGLLSNIVTLPLSGLLTMVSAGGAAAYLLHPSLSMPLLWVAGWVARAFLLVAKFFGSSPLATVSLPGPSGWLMLLWWSGLFSLVFLRGRWRWLAAASPVALVLLLVLAHTPVTRVDVTFLAVGHGDAVVVSSGDHHALIDGGGVPNGTDTGKRFVLPFLRQHLIRHLDLAVLSHAHPDHALGLASALAEVTVDRLWLPFDVGRGELVDSLVEAAGSAKVEEVSAGDTGLQLGAAQIDILGPHGARGPFDAENDRSVVLRLRHGEVTVLLAGDLEAPGEALIDPGEVTVMKAPHHGSDTSSTEALLAKARPKFVVFCVGQNNRFGFPKAPIVERYRALGARCFRTDLDGAVTFHSDGHQVTVETFAPKRVQARAVQSKREP